MLIVAKELLGKTLVHQTLNGNLSGRIVETEAYQGPEDKASHAYGNLRSKRTEVQFGPKGHAYIYQIYGMYFCLNVTAGAIVGKPEAILIRALEPVEGVEIMMKNRKVHDGRKARLTNGPGKLCMALGLTKKQNGIDMTKPPLHIDEGTNVEENNITQTTRINVDYADDWKSRPWRFYIKENEFVSKKQKSLKANH